MPHFHLGSYRQKAIASFAQINRVGEAVRPHLLQRASVDCKEHASVARKATFDWKKGPEFKSGTARYSTQRGAAIVSQRADTG